MGTRVAVARNNGAPGVDGVSIVSIEQGGIEGVKAFLDGLATELKNGTLPAAAGAAGDHTQSGGGERRARPLSALARSVPSRGAPGIGLGRLRPRAGATAFYHRWPSAEQRDRRHLGGSGCPRRECDVAPNMPTTGLNVVGRQKREVKRLHPPGGAAPWSRRGSAGLSPRLVPGR